jgi:hypothetical protein
MHLIIRPTPHGILAILFSTLVLFISGCCTNSQRKPFLTEKPPNWKDSSAAKAVHSRIEAEHTKAGAYQWWAHCNVCDQCGGPIRNQSSAEKMVGMHNRAFHWGRDVAYFDGIPCE